MNTNKIRCPSCGTEIPLADAVSHQISEELKQKWASEKKQLLQEERARLKAELSGEVSELKDRLAEQDKRLIDARNNELKTLKLQMQLEDERQKMELEVARKIAAERRKIQEEAEEAAAQRQQLAVADRDKTISDLKAQVVTMGQQLEQRSQQHQGEVLEVELEDCLRAAFPQDEIEPIGQGKNGADILQTVRTSDGKVCGKILWETKRTRRWNEGWLQKLKQDQRTSGADFGVLLSIVLPDGMKHFEEREGLWVTSFGCATPLAAALRFALVQVTRVKSLGTDRRNKADVLYHHICSLEFRQTVETLIETFQSMQAQLEQEKTAVQRLWSKREQHLSSIAARTAELFGAMQGIVGESVLPTPQRLQLVA
jgi:hypothetical protein